MLPLLLAVVLAEISEGGMDVKAIAMLGVLAAVGAALRPLGAGTAGLETVFFLLVLGGRVFGAGFGFVLGRDDPVRVRAHHRRGRAVAAVPDARRRLGRARRRPAAPAARPGGDAACSRPTAPSPAWLYGLLLNLTFWPFTTGMSGELSFVAGAPVLENLHRFLVFTLATSLGWDIGRAVTNTVLVIVTGRAVLGALRRAARRAAFEAPVEFAPAEPAVDRRRPRGTIGAMGNLELDHNPAWLSREELDSARERLPILYVDAVPVRVDERGAVTAVGLLLRLGADGGICRELVSGRVLYHERVRDALLRHIEKDLGPMALPRVPASPLPFTVAEYFPTPGRHAVPRPAPARGVAGVRRAGVRRLRPAARRARPRLAHPRRGPRPRRPAEMERGHGVLLRQALATSATRSDAAACAGSGSTAGCQAVLTDRRTAQVGCHADLRRDEPRRPDRHWPSTSAGAATPRCSGFRRALGRSATAASLIALGRYWLTIALLARSGRRGRTHSAERTTEPDHLVCRGRRPVATS